MILCIMELGLLKRTNVTGIMSYTLVRVPHYLPLVQVLVWGTKAVSLARKPSHPIHFHQIDRVLPKVFPGQPKDKVYSGSTLRPATGWARLKHLLRKPPQMVSLDTEEQRLQLRKIISVGIVLSAVTQSSCPWERVGTYVCLLTNLFTTTHCWISAAVARSTCQCKKPMT